MAAEQVEKIQVTSDAIKVPRMVLGKNSTGQEVYLYYDPTLERVVISGAMGLAYEDTQNSKIYVLGVTSPSLS